MTARNRSRICVGCGAPFEARRSTAVYCSGACRLLAFRLRNAKRPAADRGDDLALDVPELDGDGLPALRPGRRFWAELEAAVAAQTFGLDRDVDAPMQADVRKAVLAFRLKLKLALAEAVDDLQRDAAAVRRRFKDYRALRPAPAPSLAEAYRALGLTDAATPADAKRRFLQLAKLYHPDHGGNPEQFRRISAAYETIRAAAEVG